MTNLSFTGKNNQIYLLKPNKKKQFLAKLSIIDARQEVEFSCNSVANFGDVQQEEYDREYAYSLPYKAPRAFLVYQGYDGSFSHQGKNALDFSMPIGTEVQAIRNGVVVQVVEHNDKNCLEEGCKKLNNFIIIHHPDGTFAEYTHLKKDGALVEVGDTVEQDQVIGHSGNTGWSSGPHLHLEVYLQKFEERKTVKTKFLLEQGQEPVYLLENWTYKRMY